MLDCSRVWPYSASDLSRGHGQYARLKFSLELISRGSPEPFFLFLAQQRGGQDPLRMVFVLPTREPAQEAANVAEEVFAQVGGPGPGGDNADPTRVGRRLFRGPAIPRAVPKLAEPALGRKRPNAGVPVLRTGGRVLTTKPETFFS